MDSNTELAEGLFNMLMTRFPAALRHIEGKVVAGALKEELDRRLGAQAENTISLQKAWNDWITYRAQRKLRAYTELGASAQLARLSAWGVVRATAAIYYSMAQGYQGIFEASEATRGMITPDTKQPLTEWERKQKMDRVTELRMRLRELTHPGGSAYSVQLTGVKRTEAEEMVAKIKVINDELE